jgi:hypothetical protein
MTLNWASIEEYAAVQDIGLRAARKHIAKGAVQFRTVKSKSGGGKSGLSYQVLIDAPDSESLASNTFLPTVLAPALSAPTQGPMAQRWRSFKRMVIAPAMMLKLHSRERGVAIRQQAERDWQTPDGDVKRFDERTLRNWIATEMAADDLARRKRCDAGKSRVIVSKRVDAACYAAGLGQPDLVKLQTELATYAKSLRVNGHMLPKMALPRVNQHLNSLLVTQGIQAKGNPFEVPEHAFKAWQNEIRNLALFKEDRKSFEAIRPRGMTSTAGMSPMEALQVDATKVDIYYKRADGSLATPFMLTWLDVFTRRVFCSIYFFDKGKSLNNANIIQSFCDMVDAWGMPRTIFADNGSEFRFLDALEPGLQALDDLYNAGLSEGRVVIRNRAYNSQAKGMVERVQGVLNQTMFKPIHGWVGGNRMKAQSANYGGKLPFYPGPIEELHTLLLDRVAEYNGLPQRGDVDTLPPNTRHQTAIDKGFQTVAASDIALLLAFSELAHKTIRHGYISHNGKWFCRAAAEVHPTGKVWVRIPKFLKWDMLPVLLNRDDVQPIGLALRAIGNHPLDVEAAKDRAEIASAFKRNTLAKGKGLRLVTDDDALMLPAPSVAPIGATLGLTDDAIRQFPHVIEPEKDRRLREEQRRDAEQDEYLANAEKIRKIKEAQQR